MSNTDMDERPADETQHQPGDHVRIELRAEIVSRYSDDGDEWVVDAHGTEVVVPEDQIR